MSYTIGWNMPGYMPEMEPYTLDTEDDAKRAMIDELLRDAENAPSNLATELSHTAEDLNLSDVSLGWDVTVGNIAYWITPTEGE